jgi:hypothetical protein
LAGDGFHSRRGVGRNTGPRANGLKLLCRLVISPGKRLTDSNRDRLEVNRKFRSIEIEIQQPSTFLPFFCPFAET